AGRPQGLDRQFDRSLRASASGCCFSRRPQWKGVEAETDGQGWLPRDEKTRTGREQHEIGVSTQATRDRAVARSLALSVRKSLADRLRDRRQEIERETLTRIQAISGPADTDPVYSDGLRVAVATALDYGLSAIEAGEGHSSSVPPTLLT